MQVLITSKPRRPFRHELSTRTHKIISDVDASLNGGDSGPNPHELALFSLGTCAAITMELYAAKKKLDLKQVTVTVTESSVADPENSNAKIPHILIGVSLSGNLSDLDIAKLTEIGERCPVLKLFTGKKVVESKVQRAPAK